MPSAASRSPVLQAHQANYYRHLEQSLSLLCIYTELSSCMKVALCAQLRALNVEVQEC